MFKTTKNFAENNISTPKNKKPSFDGSSFCPDFKKNLGNYCYPKKSYTLNLKCIMSPSCTT